MNTNAEGGWLNSYGALFGDHRCEVHVRLESGVHVASMFSVEARSDGMIRDSGIEACGKDESSAFELACAYLTRRYGPRHDRFSPLTLIDRSILPAWPIA